jgi:hypothetical protein
MAAVTREGAAPCTREWRRGRPSCPWGHSQTLREGALGLHHPSTQTAGHHSVVHCQFSTAEAEVRRALGGRRGGIPGLTEAAARGLPSVGVGSVLTVTVIDGEAAG